ncbi:MAG: DUF1549 domain-containing protein, partial [Planctomycetia bacterium]|nr:DUF1549 domain-containing protein [Planctomycetia bacterium]
MAVRKTSVVYFFVAPPLAALVFIALPAIRADDAPPTVQFNRDIRPLLADRCFRCHGPDSGQRQAELRLDKAEGFKADLGGRQAIVPGKPDESELIRRVTHVDDEERMPPAETGERLTSGEITLLRQWIAQGAKYEPHWSFIPPRRPAVPEVKNIAWARGPIDRFILARQEAAGISPAPEADKRTLVRRLYFDLTGLPPTADEVEAFVADPRPEAYDELVDRLLMSPHYGERMAIYWLDLVRYADTV